MFYTLYGSSKKWKRKHTDQELFENSQFIFLQFVIHICEHNKTGAPQSLSPLSLKQDKHCENTGQSHYQNKARDECVSGFRFPRDEDNVDALVVAVDGGQTAAHSLRSHCPVLHYQDDVKMVDFNLWII